MKKLYALFVRAVTNTDVRRAVAKAIFTVFVLAARAISAKDDDNQQ